MGEWHKRYWHLMMLQLNFSEITQSRVFDGAIYKLEPEHCFPQFCPVLSAFGKENGLVGSISIDKRDWKHTIY